MQYAKVISAPKNTRAKKRGMRSRPWRYGENRERLARFRRACSELEAQQLATEVRRALCLRLVHTG